MEKLDKQEQRKNNFTEIKTFPVPFTFTKTKENIALSTNASSKYSKEQIINQAIQYHLQGNIKEASRYYKYCLSQGYKDTKVFCNYGIILKDLGKLQEAEISTRKAIKLKPDFAEAHSNLGNILIDLGKLEEAETSTRKAIELNPNYAEAHYNLGNIFSDLGKLKEAELSYCKAIELNPNYAEAHYNLGNILKELGKLIEAELSYCKAIELNPNYAEAHYNLGNILKELGKLIEAELSLRKAIELKPDFVEAHLNLGSVLSDLGKSQDAEVYTRKAIELKPELAEAHLNLGNILRDLDKLKDAEISTRKAIQINPKYAMAHSNLGSILMDLGKSQDAEISTRKAIDLKPDFADAYSNLGAILMDLDKLEEANQAYQKSLEIDPKQIHLISNIIYTLSRLCMWDEIEKYLPDLNRIGIEGKAIGPLALMYIEDNPLNHLKRAIKYNQEHKREELPNINHNNNNNKIKIGYFSADFRNHPLTHLLLRTLELHDKSKFEIYAYSLSNMKDDYTIRVQKAVSVFREIHNLSDLDIVKLARNDQIDIALDLNGITKYSRISIFSYRVAPIQINYLGYAGSLGSDSYDYILADKVIIPEENKKFYTEKVLHLPNSSFPHDNTRKISVNKFSREQLGLPPDGFVFTCFNSIHKITRKEFNIWLRLLHKVERSVLWIKKPHQAAMNNLYAELTHHGIDKERIIFAENMELDDHFSRHSCADLFLDTFNFNAANTANFALSSDVPVITLLGKSYSARIAASILNACNLNELVTTSYSEYESLAYELATNKEKLKTIREKLRNKNKLSFFDSSKFTNELEIMYSNLVNK
ncbi:tetratricopeptide repeat protein [Prochlorococcus marinus]|uniref:tetratricopeptide repeat protein n=1 Tax=Prochlorococcus marinus TaxID=1219 RepID=UPI0022B41DED|nr:tetratricopeptide repeat protein [Prochlorococcus marinus]